MVFLVIMILLYSIIYLTVFVLAHQDANMIKPLATMTIGMILLLTLTAIVAIATGFWYFAILIFVIAIGLISFYSYLRKN